MELVQKKGENYLRLACNLIEREDHNGELVGMLRSVEAYLNWHMNYYHLGQLYEKMENIEGAANSYKAALFLTKEYGGKWSSRYHELLDKLLD